MPYSFSGRVRYSETDEFGRLTIPALVNYFQDCSVFHSESVKSGFKTLKKDNQAWLLASWQIIIDELPVLCDEVKVSTWAYEFKAFYGNRNFTLTSPNGKFYARANSVWFLYDFETGKPVKVPDEIAAKYGVERKMEMHYAARKINVPEAGAPIEAGNALGGMIADAAAEKKEGFWQGNTFVITEQHLDTNHHVNNGQYISMAMENLPQNFTAQQVRADYRFQARLGDVVTPVIHYAPGSTETYTVGLNSSIGKPYAVVEIKGVQKI